MATVSVSIPDDLKARMDSMDETNWSGVARRAFEEHIEAMQVFKRLRAKSKLTAKDALDISGKIDEGMIKHFQSLTPHETRGGRERNIQRNNP